jgi:hypothetical protein
MSLFVHLLILHRGEKKNHHYQIKILKIRSISIEYSIKKSKQEKETTRILGNDIRE